MLKSCFYIKRNYNYKRSFQHVIVKFSLNTLIITDKFLKHILLRAMVYKFKKNIYIYIIQVNLTSYFRVLFSWS